MATKKTIKSDFLGLYVNCGGYISRPFWGTSFKENDIVNTHHFGGSTLAGVTVLNKKSTHNFKKGGFFEYWSTTGISQSDYNYKEYKLGFEQLFGGSYSNFEEYLKLNTKWYEKTYSDSETTFININKEFEINHL